MDIRGPDVLRPLTAASGDRALRASVRRIEEFWSWWAESGRAAALTMLDTGEHGRFVEEVGRRTAAVDARLIWHTEPGTHRQHRLALSAAGAIEARATAERWRRAAPPDDLWEFGVSRTGAPPEPGQVLELAGYRLTVDDVRFEVEQRARGVDVRVGHPGFAGMDERTRLEVAFLVLDLVLGEDDVERLVGGIDALPGPADGVAPDELRATTRRIGADPDWLLVDATLQDGSTAVLQIGPLLHPLDRLPYDLHTELRLRYAPRSDGLADADELQRVQAEQARFAAALGGSAVVVATEMHGGFRTVHLYSDGADRNARDVIDRLAHRRRDIRVRHDLDPAWNAVAAYRRL